MMTDPVTWPDAATFIAVCVCFSAVLIAYIRRPRR